MFETASCDAGATVAVVVFHLKNDMKMTHDLVILMLFRGLPIKKNGGLIEAILVLATMEPEGLVSHLVILVVSAQQVDANSGPFRMFRGIHEDTRDIITRHFRLVPGVCFPPSSDCSQYRPLFLHVAPRIEYVKDCLGDMAIQRILRRSCLCLRAAIIMRH